MSKFICSLPWKHLSVMPHGWSSVCCEANWDSKYALSQNFNDQESGPVHINDGVNKIVNSESFRKIRRDMLDGEVPEACLTCHTIEEAGGFSKRNKEKIIDEKTLNDITSEDGTIKPDITYLELRLGNFCNLKCRSCNAESSTSWVDDYYKLKDKINLPSGYDISKKGGVNYDWVEDPKVYLDLLENGFKLDELHISGGEPFLVDKHSYLLDLLIERDLAKDIYITYITNGNYKFERIVPILDKLHHFKEVNLNFSLDDTFKRNDYIRSLSRFETVIGNIKKYTDKYNFTYAIIQTIHVFNFLYIEQLHLYLEEKGLYYKDGTGVISTIRDNYVNYPDYHNVKVIPLEVRKKKLDSIEGVLEDNFFKRLKSNFYNTEDSNLTNEFINTTQEVDKVRREDWKELFPDLVEALKNKSKII